MAKILDAFKNAEEHKDEMVPVDQWDGECWKTFFDQFCIEAAELHGVSPWDILADFINKVYGTEGDGK